MKCPKCGSLEIKKNGINGRNKKHNRIKAIHYTLGGPWFEEYKDCEFADEWRSILRS